MSEPANKPLSEPANKPLSEQSGPGKLLAVFLGSGMVERVPDGAILVDRFVEIIRTYAEEHYIPYETSWFYELDYLRLPLLTQSIDCQRVQGYECFVGIREVAPDNLNMIMFKNSSRVLDMESARALTAPLLRYSGYYESGDNKPVIRLLETLFRDAGDPFYFRDFGSPIPDFGPPIPLVMDHITSFCMKSVRHM